MCTCISTLSCTYPTARKEHYDSSADFIKEFLSQKNLTQTGLSFAEWREIAKLKANKWFIKPGQRYEHQRNIQDGIIYSFKTIEAVGKLCHKHQIYPDFC